MGGVMAVCATAFVCVAGAGFAGEKRHETRSKKGRRVWYAAVVALLLATLASMATAAVMVRGYGTGGALVYVMLGACTIGMGFYANRVAKMRIMWLALAVTTAIVILVGALAAMSGIRISPDIPI